MTDSEAATPAALSWGRAAYDAYAEGLHTYCLAVLRDHDAAAGALRGAFVLADRHIGRLPDLELLGPWLYALARFECLVRLDADLPARARAHRGSGPPLVWGLDPGGPAAPGPAAPGPAAHDTGHHARRRAELARLAWPETAGLDAARREILELAVRHGLRPRGLAAVLGLTEAEASALLAQAGAYVDELRAALAGLRLSVNCPEGRELADRRLTAGTRGAVLEHAAVCPRCGPHVRLAAAAQAPTTGPGAEPAALPLVPPPGDLRAVVLGEIGRGRAAQRPDTAAARAARFDRAGFPVFRAGTGGRSRRRATVVAAAIVAAVVAAPAVALWQASRGTDAASTGTTIRSARVADAAPGDSGPVTGLDGGAVAGAFGGSAEGSAGAAGSAPPAAAAAGPAATVRPMAPGAAPRGTSAPPGTSPGAAAEVFAPAAGPLPAQPPPAPGPPSPGPPGPPPPPPPPAAKPVVEAEHDGGRTLVRITNPGEVPLTWRAATADPWLRLSATSGTLAPRASVVVTVTVDDARAPAGRWQATIRVEPGGSVVTIEGTTRGPTRPPATPSTRPPESPAPPVTPG